MSFDTDSASESAVQNISTSIARPNYSDLLDLIWGSLPNGGSELSVFAILDGAKNHKIYSFVHNSGLASSCLFSGKMSYAMTRAAPHVVELERYHPSTLELLELMWGNRCGIIVTADKAKGMKGVRNHCRRISKVMSPAKRPLYFRFYDPEILKVMLPVCAVEEVQYLTGPMNHIFLEKTGSSEVACHTMYRDAVSGAIAEKLLTSAELLDYYEPFVPFSYGKYFQLQQAHMDAFDKKADLDFFKVIFAKYCRVYDEDTNAKISVNGKPYSLAAYFWRCYPKAVEYKLETAQQFAVFFHLIKQYGWNFWVKPEYQWIESLLSEPRPPEIRIAKIEKQLSKNLMERLWS